MCSMDYHDFKMYFHKMSTFTYKASHGIARLRINSNIIIIYFNVDIINYESSPS